MHGLITTFPWPGYSCRTLLLNHVVNKSVATILLRADIWRLWKCKNTVWLDKCCEGGPSDWGHKGLVLLLAKTWRFRQLIGGNQVYHSWQLWERPGVCKYTIMWLDKYFEENGQIMATTLDKYSENNNEQILVTSWDKYGEDIANIVGAVQRQGVVSAVLLLCWRICL